SRSIGAFARSPRVSVIWSNAKAKASSDDSRASRRLSASEMARSRCPWLKGPSPARADAAFVLRLISVLLRATYALLYRLSVFHVPFDRTSYRNLPQHRGPPTTPTH